MSGAFSGFPVHEVVEGKLFYVSVPPKRLPNGTLVLAPLPSDTSADAYYAMEEFCVYYPFFLDFGPVALNRVYRFCQRLGDLLARRGRVTLVSGAHMQRRANSVFLLGAHGVLYRGLSPAAALAPFKGMSPALAPWHDASPQADPFHLSTLDVLRGLERAQACGFFSFKSFDLARFEHYEQVENGDMNWLADGRFLALAGPQCPQPGALPEEEGYNATTVEQLLPIFRELGITSIVRLNRKYYNEKKFTAAGVVHLDLYFEDGSNPPEALLQKFLRFCEATPGAIAVRECCHVLHAAPFPIFAHSAPLFF